MRVSHKNQIQGRGYQTISMQTKYEECEQCQEHKASQATPHNQVSSEDIFKNFMPGQRCRYTTQKKEIT